MLRKLCLTAAVLLIAVPVAAQTQNQPAAKAGGTSVDAETRQFVEKAAIGDMFEIQSSKLALDKSAAKEVDDFAQHIVDDHTKSSEKLKSIVGNMQGLQIPQELDSKHRDMLGQLQNASGQQFNQLYRKQQIDAHQEAVQLFEAYSKTGQTKELQEFATGTLPTLKEHLQKAQSLPENMPAQTVSQAPQQGQQQVQQQGPAQTQSQQRGSPERASMQPIAKPSADHILASDLEGTSVYSANNESIGEIDDVVLDRKGSVVAVIVGVGGFLGIGEKSVAIPFEALEIAAANDQGRASTTDKKGGTQASQQGPQSDRSSKGTLAPQRIVLRGMTRQDLEKAPAFDARSDTPNSQRR